MSRKRRVWVGILLCVAVAALTLATFLGRNAMAIAMGAVCALSLTWAWILVRDVRDAARE